jgi:hypothetical protein
MQAVANSRQDLKNFDLRPVHFQTKKGPNGSMAVSKFQTSMPEASKVVAVFQTLCSPWLSG